MSKSSRLAKSFYRLLFPVAILFITALVAGSVWFISQTSKPASGAYLITPEKFGQISSRGSQITDESWPNNDGTNGRGWLLRGSENSPAVILLHRYGADRSHILNLGVKLNEATNFTVLMPDLRGHGEKPTVAYTSFGGCEGADTSSAIAFLRGLKGPSQLNLVGSDIGIYGVEMGSLAGISAAAGDTTVRSVVLDSVPRDSDSLLASVIDHRYPFMSTVTSRLGQLGTYPYFYEGCYSRTPACKTAKSVTSRKALLLSGLDAPEFQESTDELEKCFPDSTQTESVDGLSPSGYSILDASMNQSDVYAQRVIDFFRSTLGPPPMIATQDVSSAPQPN